MKKLPICIISTILCLSFSINSFSATAKGPGEAPEYAADTMPQVTWKMMDASFWVDDKDTEQRLMSEAEIAAFNEKCADASGTGVKKIKDMVPDFNGIKIRDSLASFATPVTRYLNGTAVTEEYYEAIRNNIRNASVSDTMTVRYGICTKRTELKAYPYGDMLSDSLDDNEWDDFVNAPLLVNEPLAVYIETSDGQWYYVESESCYGWVRAADIALCHDKEEFLAASDYTDFLLVTGSSIRTEKTSLSQTASEMDLEMGTKLRLCTEDAQMVHNRMSWYNYIVYIPIRNADGTLGFEKALIPANRDVSTSYLKLSRGNIVKQAFKCLGNRYGWGGMMGAHDCSSFVREIYLCFGMELGRNTTMQGKMPCRKISLLDMTDEQKCDVLDTVPIGSILQFRGHEMLYIGEYKGEYYTINDVSSLAIDQSDGSLKKYRVRDVIINGLLCTKRANGKTWMESLDLIIIPFEKE